MIESLFEQQWKLHTGDIQEITNSPTLSKLYRIPPLTSQPPSYLYTSLDSLTASSTS